MRRKNAYILLLILFLIVGGAGCFVYFIEPELFSVAVFVTPAPENATLSAPVRNSTESVGSEEVVLPTLPALSTESFEETEETMESMEVVESVESEETTETETKSAPTETADAPQKQYTYTAIHKSKRLFIRKDASMEADIIGSLKPGDSGDVIDIGEDWVLLKHGRIEGYVFKKYLLLTEQP